MAVLSNAERLEAMAAMMRSRNIGSVTKTDLKAGIDATDNWIDSNQASFNTALPEPLKSAATTQEKTILFCYVALKRAGLLNSRGI